MMIEEAFDLDEWKRTIDELEYAKYNFVCSYKTYSKLLPHEKELRYIGINLIKIDALPKSDEEYSGYLIPIE